MLITMLTVVLVCYFMIILTLQVQWSPHNETILASSGTVRQVPHVWVSGMYTCT